MKKHSECLRFLVVTNSEVDEEEKKHEDFWKLMSLIINNFFSKTEILSEG